MENGGVGNGGIGNGRVGNGGVGNGRMGGGGEAPEFEEKVATLVLLPRPMEGMS